MVDGPEQLPMRSCKRLRPIISVLPNLPLFLLGENLHEGQQSIISVLLSDEEGANGDPITHQTQRHRACLYVRTPINLLLETFRDNRTTHR